MHPRLSYACSLAFEYVSKLNYCITTLQNPCHNAQVVVYYTPEAPSVTGPFLWIKAHGLLHNSAIEAVAPHVQLIGRAQPPQVFAHAAADLLGYDVLAAIFFMASRYEEYLPYAPDAYGRFGEAGSLSGKYGFTHLPVVHWWVKALLVKLFPDRDPASYMPHRPSVLFTYDIDVAYAFRGRPLMLQIAGLCKDVVQGRCRHVWLRLSSLGGNRFDPSDTYKYICSHSFPRKFFILAAGQKTAFDRNLPPHIPAWQQLVKQLSVSEVIGMHPSYYSNEKPGHFSSEKALLEKIIGKPITFSRQHYLKLQLPNTYRHLIEAGITHDFSMQYPEKPGFRAGMAVPYPFFDVAANRVTSLILHPGCIMETTFRDDLHLTAAESWPYYLQLWEEVKKVGGTFICIWHNDTLWANLPDNHPLAFRQIHQKLIETLQEQKAEAYPHHEG